MTEGTSVLYSIGILVARLGMVCVAAVLLTEFAGRVGLLLLRLLRCRSFNALERLGFSVILGWALVGFTYLGLSLCSVFSPLLIVAVALSLLVFSFQVLGRTLLVVSSYRLVGPVRTIPLLLMTVPCAVLGLNLVLPEMEGASWSYNLGIPWQYLQVGRALLEYVPVVTHVPLTYEMTFALPLSLHDDRYAKTIVLTCFIAGCLVFSGRCVRERLPISGWLGPILTLSSGSMLLFATVSKGDMPAAAAFIAGVFAQLAGSWVLGGLLLGTAIASKLVVGPAVALWCVFVHPPLRRMGWWLTAIILPSVPWYAKSWLATGNPLYPFASRIVPSLEWGELNREGLWRFAMTHVPEGPVPLIEVPLNWFFILAQKHTLVLLFLPGILLLGRRRKMAWFCVAGQLLTMATSRLHHYLLPLMWLTYLLIAEEIGKASVRRRNLLVAFAVSYSLCAMVCLGNVTREKLRLAASSWPKVQQELYTTFADGKRELEKMGFTSFSWGSRMRATPRMLLVAEFSTYMFPCRALFNGIYGETPVIWKIVRESRGSSDIRRKLRQLGVKVIAYNLVTSRHPNPGITPFKWNREDLEMWSGFVRRELDLVSRPETLDHKNGAFCFYSLRTTPRARPPGSLPYLPGIESAYTEVTQHGAHSDYESFTNAALRLDREVPGVDFIKDLVGLGYFRTAQWQKAYQYYLPGIRHGTLDDYNYWRMADLSDRLGYTNQASELFARSLEVYPEVRRAVTRLRPDAK